MKVTVFHLVSKHHEGEVKVLSGGGRDNDGCGGDNDGDGGDDDGGRGDDDDGGGDNDGGDGNNDGGGGDDDGVRILDSDCIYSVGFIKLRQVCENQQTCCALLKQLASSLWISLDNQLAASL